LSALSEDQIHEALIGALMAFISEWNAADDILSNVGVPGGEIRLDTKSRWPRFSCHK
jgi:hypothetical protein